MRIRDCFSLLLLLSTGCIDSLLEGDHPELGHLSIRITPSVLSLSQGAEGSLSAQVTRTGGSSGPASLSVRGLPEGVTSTVEELATADSITTAVIRIRVGSGVPPGAYPVEVRGRKEPLLDGVAQLRLEIVAPEASPTP